MSGLSARSNDYLDEDAPRPAESEPTGTGFMRPPGVIRDFRLTINTVWSCKVLLLFAFETEADPGIKRHKRASVSLQPQVLREYDENRPGN